MEKRFWRMKPAEAMAFVQTYGESLWQEKIAEDRRHAAEELADMPNPWLEGGIDPERQRLISELAPKVAEGMRREAEEMHRGRA